MVTTAFQQRAAARMTAALAAGSRLGEARHSLDNAEADVEAAEAVAARRRAQLDAPGNPLRLALADAERGRREAAAIAMVFCLSDRLPADWPRLSGDEVRTALPVDLRS